MRLSRSVFVAVLSLASIRFAIQYASLPENVASHFGTGGAPNGWMPRQVFAWFSLIPLAVSVIVAFVGPLMVKRMPASMINFPNKEYWLVPERKDEAFARFASHMEWFGTALLLFLAFTYELLYLANRSPGLHLSEGPFIAGLIAFIGFMIIWTVALYRRFRVPAASTRFG